jgi:hypothetical protein
MEESTQLQAPTDLPSDKDTGYHCIEVWVHVSQRSGEARTKPIKNRRTRLKPTQASLMSAVKYIISIMDSEGNMLVKAHVPTVYTVQRIKSKTK